jgi:hypothetical protein
MPPYILPNSNSAPATSSLNPVGPSTMATQPGSHDQGSSPSVMEPMVRAALPDRVILRLAVGMLGVSAELVPELPRLMAVVGVIVVSGL